MKTRHFVMTLALIAAGVAAAIAITSTSKENNPVRPTDIAIFSGGCFWGLQAAFDEVKGVVRSRVGYTGGTVPNPTYSRVVFGKTGHAEAVEVVFDPSIVSFAELLQRHIKRVKTRDALPPADYASDHSRAAVFVKNEDQRAAAEAALADEELRSKHIRIEAASMFWEAEAEHQNHSKKCLY